MGFNKGGPKMNNKERLELAERVKDRIAKLNPLNRLVARGKAISKEVAR